MDVGGLEILGRLGVALAIGLLIGMEREWTDQDNKDIRTAGLRTFGLIGLTGGVWGLFAARVEDAGLVALAIAFAVFSAVFAVYRLRELADAGKFGATPTIAAMSTFSLGAMSLLAPVQVAAASAIAVTLLLVGKSSLHAWARSVSWEEFRAALILLVMSVVVLPLLPNRDLGPYEALNPFQLWLLTVVLAGVSFAGYIALKAAGGSAGAAVSGLAGGLASSTAATISLARHARENEDRRRELAGGAVLAGVTMIMRIALFVAVLHASLLWYLAFPLGAAALVFAGIGAWLVWRGRTGRDDEETLVLRNPFELGTVLQIGALLAVILVASKIAVEVGGGEGAIAIAALSGLASVDAAALAFARFDEAGISPQLAALAICVAAATNTLAKAALGWWRGGRYFGLVMTLSSVAAIAAGAGAFFLSRGMTG